MVSDTPILEDTVGSLKLVSDYSDREGNPQFLNLVMNNLCRAGRGGRVCFRFAKNAK